MHRPSTAILNQFHKVLVLDHGGQMAYWGDVPGMMRYFRKAAAVKGSVWLQPLKSRKLPLRLPR